MFNNFLKSFLINCTLLVSIICSSYAQAESTVCLQKGYNNPNKLIGDRCLVWDALFATSGDENLAGALTMMSFTNTSKGMNSLGDIDLFFSGSKKACLHCSGTTESELKAAEEKLLERVNSSRSEYGATLYRDVVINNQISASELTFGTNDDLLTCSEEIEQLDSDCQEAFKNSLKTLEGFKGINFKEINNKNVDTSDVFHRLKNNTLMTVAGTRRDYGMHMFKNISSTRSESEDASSINMYLTTKSQTSFQTPDSVAGQEIFESRMFTYKDAVTHYYKTEESFIEKLSKATAEDYESYCSGKNNKLIDSISSEVDVLDSYASLSGKINKTWICNSFKSGDFEPSEIKNKSLKKLFNDKNYRIDLKERIKKNCQKQFKEIEETVCRPKKEIDPSVFYNSKSIYSEEPFDMLTSELEEVNEILAFRALACIYHDQAGEAAVTAKGITLGDGHSGAVTMMMNGATAAQGFLSKSSRPKSESTVTEVSEFEEKSDLADISPSGESEVANNLDTPNPFDFLNKNNSKVNNVAYPAYNPLTPPIQNLDDSENISSIENRLKEDEKNLNQELAELKKRKEEVEKELAAVKESADKKTLDKKIKEKQELDKKIAELENKKEEIITKRADLKDKRIEQVGYRTAKVSSSAARAPASSNNNISTSSQQTVNEVTGNTEVDESQSASQTASFSSNSISGRARSTGELEVIYNKKLDELLTNAGKSLDQGMLELIEEMADNNIPINFIIESRNGVTSVVFLDINRLVKLSDFEPEIQREFQKGGKLYDYRNRELASSNEEKRSDIDLNLEDEGKDKGYNDLIDIKTKLINEANN